MNDDMKSALTLAMNSLSAIRASRQAPVDEPQRRAVAELDRVITVCREALVAPGASAPNQETEATFGTFSAGYPSSAPPDPAPLREQFPIPLHEGQEAAIKEWAADDRLWTIQETVEFNLRVFARKILALASSPPVARDTHTDCRTEEGVTVGLIDSLITAARVLRRRDCSTSAVVEALKDLRSDSDVAALLATQPKFEVSEIQDGEDNSGELRSTDIFMGVAGVSLLVSVPASAHEVTCSYRGPDGSRTSGVIHPAPPVASPATCTWRDISTLDDADTPVLLWTPRHRLTDLPQHIAPEVADDIRVSTRRNWTWATKWMPLDWLFALASEPKP